MIKQTHIQKKFTSLFMLGCLASIPVACSSSSSSNGKGGSTAKGGSTTGGVKSGGATASGGSTQSTGGSKAGGATSNGGSTSTGGTTANTGGSSSGGAKTGGATANGGSTGSSGGSTGSSGGTTGSTGGTTGSTGGSTGSSGGSTGSGSALSCKDSVYGDVSIPASAVISDFEDNSLMPHQSEGRGANSPEGWRGWASDNAYSPEASPNTFKIDPSVHGPCSSKGALHITSAGPDKKEAYAAFGVNVMGFTAEKKKIPWDASKYTGVGFWAKCANDLPFAFLKLIDGNNDADMPSATCFYGTAPKCVQHGVKNAVLTKDWTYYKLYFDEVLQDPNGENFTPKPFDKSKFLAFQVHVNPFSTRKGTPSINPIDCHIDDVHFLSEPTPTTPSATVTWSVSGTKIMRNGAEHKIRGLVRPSMEWDYAGFGITREDAQRMKAWKPNAIRLAILDTLWNGAKTGEASGNGESYKLHVKRAVSWYLQQGLDVILDLHYVSGTPEAKHATFWDNISKDSFFKDGRIIFELYNEPTADVGTLRTWMNSTIATIRGNGAKNLILVSGPDYTYDLSGYVSSPVTDSANAVAYAVHPYIFKPDPNSWKGPSAKLPSVATEFGDANVPTIPHTIAATDCKPGIYSDYMSSFESIGMSWTAWAWIVDEWGCGFPQMIQDWSGTPNAIGKPVKDQLSALSK